MGKSTYNHRKEAGICVICGKTKARENGVTCEQCLEKQRICRKETREFYKKMGICPKCGINKLFGDEKTCPECLARDVIYRSESRKRSGKTNMDYFRQNQKKLKENGLCRTGCGRKRAPGKTYCKICLIKHRERSREYRRKTGKDGLNRSERPNYGLCYTCGEPLDRDGRVCSKCAEKMTSNLPRTRDNQNWRKQNAALFTPRK